MSDERQPRDEAGLDFLLRHASQEEGVFRRPDDESIWAYVAGAASEEQREEMHTALLASPAFRRELQEIVADQERLADPDLVAEFAAGLEPERPKRTIGLLDRIRSFFWNPALAWTAVLVALAGPVYRTLLGPSGPGVLNSQFVTLVGSGDGQPGAALPLRLERGVEVVDLTVWDQDGPSRGAVARYRAILLRGDQEIWRQDDFQGLIETEYEFGYRLLLDPGLLSPGEYELRIEKLEDAQEDPILSIRSLFRIEEPTENN